MGFHSDGIGNPNQNQINRKKGISHEKPLLKRSEYLYLKPPTKLYRNVRIGGHSFFSESTRINDWLINNHLNQITPFLVGFPLLASFLI